ncbi:hypothetical protein ABIE85_004236 [Bradyrhizobium diazoefficiens]|uniref:hypothetical protein n=1 Tax=Bradyrhizobium diazoefficiens TaxID=1355477 RepID=UPI0027147C50|nr:hypothetical protein [Bradyrhizobium diazoefficiens]WLA54911.1 hypothetical protein QIH81_30875 [Bradyrhizobium diazoefficiens]
MAVWELYSKRRKKELGQLADVFTYDTIPGALRTQVVQMWNEAIGVEYRADDTETIQDTYLQIAQILRREYGVFKLSNSRDPGDRREAMDKPVPDLDCDLRSSGADRIVSDRPSASS